MRITQAENWRPGDMPTLIVGRLARALLKLHDERLSAIGLTASQFPVLVALKNGEARTQKELAVLTEVEQPSMAQLLMRMERDALVHRRIAPGDRRSSLIALTSHAMRQLEPGRDALRAVDDEACTGLSTAERKTLAALLRQVAANVAAAP